MEISEAVEELATQSGELLNGRPVEAKVIAKQIAFNCVPQIDKFESNGYTKEEMKMFWETQKIMEDKAIRVNATAVRVPVFYGHSEAVHIETRRKISVEQVRELLAKAPGVVLMDERKPGGYPTAATEAATPEPTAGETEAPALVEPLTIEVGYALVTLADERQGGTLLSRLKGIRRQIGVETGIVVPPVRIRDNLQLPPHTYRILLRGEEIGHQGGGGHLHPTAH